MATSFSPANNTTVTTAANFIPKLWSDEIIASYKKNLVLANLVMKMNFTGKKGDTVHIPAPVRGSASAKTAANAVTLIAESDSRGRSGRLLDQFDLVAVRIFHEGDHGRAELHRSRWTRDLAALLNDVVADRLHVRHADREMAEARPDLVGFGLVPVVGELDQRRAASKLVTGLAGGGLVLVGGQEHQGEATLVVLSAAHLLHPEQVAVEVHRGIEIAHAQHGVQESHGDLS